MASSVSGKAGGARGRCADGAEEDDEVADGGGNEEEEGLPEADDGWEGRRTTRVAEVGRGGGAACRGGDERGQLRLGAETSVHRQ